MGPFIQLLQSVCTNSGSSFLQAQHKERLIGVFSINSKMKNYIELNGILPKVYYIAEGQEIHIYKVFITAL